MTSYQSRASAQGEAFERHVEAALERGGWAIKDRRSRVTALRVEVDLVALDPDGVEWWIECKGSWESDRNGLRRTDTTKKAIASAALLAADPDRRPYLLVTSDLPAEGSTGDLALTHALSEGWITRILEVQIEAIGRIGEHQ
jgi:Holliday junction resolvase